LANFALIQHTRATPEITRTTFEKLPCDTNLERKTSQSLKGKNYTNAFAIVVKDGWLTKKPEIGK